MANTITQFTEATKCLNLLGEKEKLAAKVYFMLARYTAILALPAGSITISALATNSACLNNLSEPTVDSAFVAIEGQKAVTAGAPVSATDMAALATAIACLKIYGEEQLRAMELFLEDLLP